MTTIMLSDDAIRVEDYMPTARSKSSKAPDEALVAEYVAALVAARDDRGAYDAAVNRINSDKRLLAPSIIAIAQRYAGGGKKQTSRLKAFEVISKRFVEITRFHAKSRIAANARPW